MIKILLVDKFVVIVQALGLVDRAFVSSLLAS